MYVVLGASGHSGSVVAETLLTNGEKLRAVAATAGPNAHAGTPAEAVAFGELVLLSVPWAAVPDHPSAACWAELGALLGPDGGAVLIRPDPIALPLGWATVYAGTAVQMTAPPGAITAAAPPTPDRPVEVLGRQDLVEAALTRRPGAGWLDALTC